MTKKRIIVIGTVASDPYAGMAWMHMQIAVGLKRLGHEVYYFEVTSTWPYDPVRQMLVCDSDYALPYLARVADSFGLAGQWAYRRSYADKEWFGLRRAQAEDLLAHADAVLNISGATAVKGEGLKVGRLIHFGTDPGYYEIATASGNELWLLDDHDDFVTYGENIGNPDCPIPPLPRLRSKTRQPVLLDLWESGPPSREVFTTVGNWKQTGRDVQWQGETYYWSKHHEFLKFMDLPLHTNQTLELAMTLGNVDPEVLQQLASNGWQLTDAHVFTTDPWTYRDYVRASRGECTVAKDQYVRLRSGWFSERSACYLAAGRPVITQDTGFGCSLPTCAGLFAFNTAEDVLSALDAINSAYQKHSQAARAIAEEYFRAETVLAKVLNDLGV